MIRALLVIVCAVAGVAAVVGGLLRAGDTARRPEGAAERLLHALSLDEVARAERWAEAAVTDGLVDFDPDDDTRFATIEVGRAATTGAHAVVPARVVRNDAANTAQDLSLTAVRAGNDWRITAIEVVDRAPVPSTGGDRPARAPVVAWVALAAVGLVVASSGDMLITRLRRKGAHPDDR